LTASGQQDHAQDGGEGRAYTSLRFHHHGSLSPMPAAPTATVLSDADYRAKAHAMLDRVEAQVDAWLDADVVDIDSHRTGGLLELSFPNGSKIILNTQPPLQEIWLAAKAGGYHFRFVDGLWLDTRDGCEFLALLSANASAQAGTALQFSA